MPERPPAPVPVCQVLFRISDAKGNWIERASIHIHGSSEPTETDSAGRSLRLVKFGDRISGTVDSPGYAGSPAFHARSGDAGYAYCIPDFKVVDADAKL